jgi:hypothetical protein
MPSFSTYMKFAVTLPSSPFGPARNTAAPGFTLEVYFRGHAASQGIVLPAEIWVVRARVDAAALCGLAG